MQNSFPPDYEERVYAGVLGKLIGVYLGRPFEQWSHEGIARRWGEIRRYVHDDQGVPLIVTDDDITGTFTFVRALLDHEITPELSSAQIGESWLNYIAEGVHVLWWGGMGMSTEHTAYLRLKAGIPAPRSGSIELNGRAVAEEIGAQIFIDGWALLSPGRPQQAAELARQAARVSHDGEAVHGAVVLAVMESLAFVERDIEVLTDSALEYVPPDCEIARLIGDVRRRHAADADWRVSLGRLVETYGYERYGTNCPMIPNHGIIHLALRYGRGNFDESMMIVNTAGYDTDCNSGNLGCLLGIRNGLDAFAGGYDWRSPVNDRLFLPSADGQWGVMDATNLALRLAAMGRALGGQRLELPFAGPRYSFTLPGSTHGFAASELAPRISRAAAVNDGIELQVIAPGLRCDAEVNTFVPPEALNMGGYAVTASPTLYPSQTVQCVVRAGAENRAPVQGRLYVRAYGGRTAGFGEPGEADDPSGAGLVLYEGPEQRIEPGDTASLQWIVPETGGAPIAKVGVSVRGDRRDTLVVREMEWRGAPDVTFALPESAGTARTLPPGPAGADDSNGAPAGVNALDCWKRSFMSAVDRFDSAPGRSFDLKQGAERAIVHTGAEEWTDYEVTATVTPVLASAFGIVARVQGLQRYYGLVLSCDGSASIVRQRHGVTELCRTAFRWSQRTPLTLSLRLEGDRISAALGGETKLAVEDAGGEALTHGGIGFLLEEGRITAPSISVAPAI